MLTIVEHTQTPDGGYRIAVRVPDTSAATFGGIAGTAEDEHTTELVPVDDGEGGTIDVEQRVPTGDALVTLDWGADTTDEYRRAETRRLIEHALAPPAAPAPEPITPPGTEL